MAVSFAIKSWISSGVIAAVVAINITVGFTQEYAAEKTMEALRTLSSPTATVVRSSQAKVVITAEIVPVRIPKRSPAFCMTYSLFRETL